MKRVRNRMLRAVTCLAGLAVLAAGGAAWAAELPWEWEGRMAFGGERSEWVVDLDGAPERVEVRLEGGGGRFRVDEASWDGTWNGTPLGEFGEGTDGGWEATGLPPWEKGARPPITPENVIMGQMIPAGTGFSMYRNIKLVPLAEPIPAEDLLPDTLPTAPSEPAPEPAPGA